MILFKTEPYPLQMKNIMLLDDEPSGGVVYVNKSTYDQALMLSARLDGDPNRVLQLIKSVKTDAYSVTFGLKDVVPEMMRTMPKPINMLAPFLAYCCANTTLEWDPKNREMAYGILHIYSQMIDFNAMTLVPAQVRNEITFPTSILMTYKDSWNDLCSSLRDNVVLGAPMAQATTPIVQTVITTAPVTTQTPVESPSTSNTSEEEDIMAEIQKMMEEEAAANAKAREERQKVLDAVTKETPKTEYDHDDATPASTTTPASEEAAKSNAILDEFDV